MRYTDFVDQSGNIRCTNYKCGYEGPVGGRDGSGSIVIGSDGKEIDLTKLNRPNPPMLETSDRGSHQILQRPE